MENKKYIGDASQEEINSVNEYIKSISTDTGINFLQYKENMKELQELQELREYKNKVERFILK